MDARKGLDVIYIDLARAFDTVPHNLLLAKLHGCGINGPCYNWLKDYLLNRRFRVKVDGTLSDPTTASSGVPRALFLAP